MDEYSMLINNMIWHYKYFYLSQLNYESNLKETNNISLLPNFEDYLR